MSSPIANRKPTFFQKELVGFHQRAAHSNRIARLSECLGKAIADLPSKGQATVQALDVGCGDMTIAENISNAHPNIQWNCTDIHPLPPQLGGSVKWEKYRPFDGRNLPFETASFDVVMLSDVLHHCMPQAESLLREANRVGKYVIVKDHYERGFFSRQMLRLMDFVGNYGYGVKVPSHYFTPETFAAICNQAGLSTKIHHAGIDLYADFPILKFLLNKNWQFFAVLER